MQFYREYKDHRTTQMVALKAGDAKIELDLCFQRVGIQIMKLTIFVIDPLNDDAGYLEVPLYVKIDPRKFSEDDLYFGDIISRVEMIGEGTYKGTKSCVDQCVTLRAASVKDNGVFLDISTTKDLTVQVCCSFKE